MLFLCLYAARVFNSWLLLHSYYYPDEYFQSLEIAHSDTYASGFRSWEYSDSSPIRGPLYPLVFSAFYRLLSLCNVDFSFLVAYGPRLLLQPILAGLMDLYLLKYILQHVSRSMGVIGVFVSLSMFFSLNLATRTLANSTEGALFMLSFFHWQNNRDGTSMCSEVHARLFVTLNFLIRSTSLMVWPLLFLLRLVCLPKESKSRYLLVNLVHALLSLLLALSIDYLYFGKFVFTAWNFIDWNVIQGLSSFFS